VTVDGEERARIGPGALLLVGVEQGDGPGDADTLARKVAGLRFFDDEAGKLNLSLADVGGAVLAVSQFTLLADCRKGRRPSFVRAADPENARVLFDRFVDALVASGLRVERGVFQTAMEVELVNQGPVTLLLSSGSLKKK
jgi:D-tyrosyl-tRNA(Tyr) deacylase